VEDVMADWAALAAGLAGAVVLPSAPGYEAVRRPADPRFHHLRPAAVVRCAGPADVAETITFVRRAGLPAVVRGGGHDFAGGSSTTGVVIDMALMDAVSVADGQALVGAGARLDGVYDELSGHGLTIPAGCGPSVGIAGLTLGGGLGVLGRRHGLTCDRLRAAEVVLADGRIVTCDERRHADLFWALRGGTGRYGAVTALTFDPVPAPAMTSFRLTWPLRGAAAVVEAWQAWAPAAPDDLSASLHLIVPADPEDAPVASIVGTMAGQPVDAAPWLEDVVARVGVEPASAEQRHATHRETKRMLAADGLEQPGSYAFSSSAFFARPLPPAAVGALIRHLGAQPATGQMRILDFTAWGGAYNRVRPDATAFVHRDALFLLHHQAVAGPQGSAAARDWLRASYGLTAAWRSDGVYQNFPDPELTDPARAYFGANLPRLRQVQAGYDPDGFFGSR
jgi:FAD/FMN-containing dehydrogenase